MQEMELARIVRETRSICIRMEQCANMVLAQKELTAAQAHILLYILRHSDQGVCPTTIHREFGCSKGALSCILKRLQENGYVQVCRCTEDDRRKLLFATEKAAALQQPLAALLRDLETRFYSCYSAEELETLDQLQKKMLQNLSHLTQPNRKEASKS